MYPAGEVVFDETPHVALWISSNVNSSPLLTLAANYCPFLLGPAITNDL